MRHHILHAFVAVLLVCGLAALAAQGLSAGETAAPASPQAVPLISVQDLQKLMQKDGSLLIYDVRQPEEFNEGHIKGAILMPLGDLPTRCKEIPHKKKLVVYCHSGHRSAQAVAFLLAHGYPDAVSLSGGYAEWSRVQASSAK